MKLQQVAKLILGSILIMNLLILVVEGIWKRDHDDLKNDWVQYRQTLQNKSALLSKFRETLGYGGMIHNLKNYVLRSDLDYILKVHYQLQEIMLAIEAYRSMETTEQERLSLNEIENIRHKYLDAAVTAEKMKLNGAEATEIDKVIRVDDKPAFLALNTLSDIVYAANVEGTNKINLQFEKISRFSVNFGFGIVIVLLAWGVGFFVFIKKNVVSPIYRMLDSFNQIDVERDISQRIQLAPESKQTELDELALAANQFLDIAERHTNRLAQAESQAKDNEQRLAAILNGTAEGIVTIDANGIILSFNSKCEDIFGYKADEVLDRNVSCLMRPDERVAHQQYLKHAKKMVGRIINANRELKGQRKDGTVFPMELTVSSVEIKKQTCYIGVLQDISARKAYERKLLDAKTEAEQANMAKSQFLSAMSHELRTPLNAILGFSQLMCYNTKEPLSELQRKNTEQILLAGKHLLELINDILDLTKIESGNFDIEFEQVELGMVLDECIHLVTTDANRLQVELINEHDSGLPVYLESNQIRLKQVLLNLITNAIKYNVPQGKVYIASENIGSNRLRITVRDTGVGIDKANYDSVFEPFVRFDQRANEIEGTGIGLSVCAKLVNALRGEIGFVSQVGEGTTFFVELPLVSRYGRRSPTELDNMMKDIVPLDFSDKTLLYIEDNKANRQLVRVLVGNISNIRFIEAVDAQSGLQMLEENDVDIVFMDINLPGMDGLEAMRKLRSDEKYRKLPIIAISAAASIDDIRQGSEAGFDYYLTKPVDLPQLTEIIRNALT